MEVRRIMLPGTDFRLLGGCELQRVLEKSGDAAAAELLRVSPGFRMRVIRQAEVCAECADNLTRLLDEERFGRDTFHDIPPEDLEVLDELESGS